MTEQSKIWQVEKAFLPVGLKSLAAILNFDFKVNILKEVINMNERNF
jgi:hypothetical protein